MVVWRSQSATPTAQTFLIGAPGGHLTGTAVLSWSPGSTPTVVHDYTASGIEPTKVAASGTTLYVGAVVDPGILNPSTDAVLIRRVMSDGTGDTQFGQDPSAAQPPFTGSRHPEVVVVAPDGFIIVITRLGSFSGGGAIHRGDPTTGDMVHLTDVPAGAWGASFRPSDGTLWTTDFHDSIVQWSITGGGSPSITSLGTWTNPGSIFGGLDWLGDVLYITDPGRNALDAFDPATATFSTVLDTSSDPNARLWEDCATSGGRIYMSDRNAFFGEWHIESVLPDGSDFRPEYIDTTPTWLGLGITAT